MLLVEPPDRGRLLSVLEGLLDGTYSREEIVTWREGILAEYGEIELSIDDGFWYFESLAALTIPFSIEPDDEFFVRNRDIEEYVLDLKQIPSEVTFEGVTRVREHQTDREALRWPLLMFEQPDVGHLDDIGLSPVRGIFDPHRDLVEHTHLFYEGELYLLVRQYDDKAHQLMVLGTSRDEDRMKRFLSALDLA